MPGRVLTFYSYKGGVGRSFALANVAVLLARWGHRVLCVDWDLEAPGLRDYFGPMLNNAPTSGVVNLVDDFLAGRPPRNEPIRLIGLNSLYFIPAGGDGPEYVRQVQTIDWARLYDQGFGEFLEQCREQWTANYDFVLLDSRTGVSDIGSICTAHLPDRLVVLFTANVQSIRGAVDVATRANVARDHLPYDRPQVTILPVLSRFDSRDEYGRAEEWRQICHRETKQLYDNWLSRRVTAETMSRHLTLPYVSYWSFGEQLPVRAETTPAVDQISYALETVAAVIAQDFDRTDLLGENRDAYVSAARNANRVFNKDVRVSVPRSVTDFVEAFVKQLDDLDIAAEISLSGADRSVITAAEESARHLCLVVNDAVTKWQLMEAELFLRGTLGQDRRLIPVLVGTTSPNVLPGYLGNLRYLRWTSNGGVAALARGLAAELGKEMG
jgi:MinD-like ATPase involved in chromosome partitioning or flagellar assembly